MTNPAWKKLREDFIEEFMEQKDDGWFCYMELKNEPKEIVDWWLDKIQSLLASELQAVLGEKEECNSFTIHDTHRHYILGWNSHREACLKKAKERGIILTPKEREY